MNNNNFPPESFFNVFTFYNMMHDAVDFAITYEVCEIERDIVTASGFKLNKGDHYQTVYFDFQKAEFQFINWIPDYSSKYPRNNYEPNPDESIDIPQAELAPFLKW